MSNNVDSIVLGLRAAEGSIRGPDETDRQLLAEGHWGARSGKYDIPTDTPTSTTAV